MKQIVWLLLCCLVCFSVVTCTKKKDSEETTATTETTKQEEATEQEEAAKQEEATTETAPVSMDAFVGKWEVTKWTADDVDQMDMWHIKSFMVEFTPQGVIESHLVYDNGDERDSKGTWMKGGDKLEITVRGENDKEGDEPFERSREFEVVKLTGAMFHVMAKIGPEDDPIVITYMGRRLTAQPE